MPTPRLSLVVPAFNEERYLPRLIESVRVARERYEAAGGSMEVIVADNRSTDRTAEVARELGCVVARVEKQSIAAARNGGARVAQGELLAFVDADIIVHPDSFTTIDHFLSSDAVVGGSTGVTLERWSPGLFTLWLVFSVISVLTKVDTGVVFCRRKDFDLIGGYDETYRAAEDVRFAIALWRLAWARGQWVIRTPRAKAVWSTRKFDQYGDWHYAKMLKVARSITTAGGPEAAFVEEYWYKPNR